MGEEQGSQNIDQSKTKRRAKLMSVQQDNNLDGDRGSRQGAGLTCSSILCNVHDRASGSSCRWNLTAWSPAPWPHTAARGGSTGRVHPWHMPAAWTEPQEPW